MNFDTLLQSANNRAIEKCRCIIAYFIEAVRCLPKGAVTVERRSTTKEDLPDWEFQSKKFGRMNVQTTCEGTIEGNVGMMERIFANALPGGWVLGSSCAMEEIQFTVAPELITHSLNPWTKENQLRKKIAMQPCNLQVVSRFLFK